MSATINLDQGTCIGAGNCVEVAPEIFRQDETTGTAEVLTAQVDGAREDEAELAADVCPVAAILLARG